MLVELVAVLSLAQVDARLPVQVVLPVLPPVVHCVQDALVVVRLGLGE
jgi:hypothetical protein